MLRTLRVLLGLLLASLVAGLVLVLHVANPAQLMELTYDVLRERLVGYAYLTALYATQIAMFIVPFGLLLAIIAESNRWRSVIVSVVFGLLLAIAGYVLQYQSEGELRTIINPFAAQVFALQGLLGGLTYWLVSGRFAGWRRGGGLLRPDPIPVDRPRLQVADAVEPTARTGTGDKPASPKKEADVEVIADRFKPVATTAAAAPPVARAAVPGPTPASAKLASAAPAKPANETSAAQKPQAEGAITAIPAKPTTASVPTAGAPTSRAPGK